MLSVTHDFLTPDSKEKCIHIELQQTALEMKKMKPGFTVTMKEKPNNSLVSRNPCPVHV
jgi:hypothetical protein